MTAAAHLTSRTGAPGLAFGTGLFGLAVTVLSCVLPDRDINIVDEDIQNKHAVRIIEPTQLSAEAKVACDAAFAALQIPLVCQLGDPATSLPHFLDPASKPIGAATSYDFCSCPPGEKSSVRLLTFTLYVEDRPDDVDEDVELFAAAQLDLRPGSVDPHLSVRYTQIIDPDDTLPDETAELDYRPLKRPKPQIRSLTFGLDEATDLCNDANDTPLAPGFHTLRLIVTDRPWFQPAPDPDHPDVTPPDQPGVPDIAGGATFDTVTYVFHCDDPTADHCQEACAPPVAP